MTTTPVLRILDRESVLRELASELGTLSTVLTEVVNKGTWLLDQCRFTDRDQEHEHFALLFLFRQMIKLTDGIEVLVRNGCPGPGVLLLRSLFELHLYIDYLLDEPARYRERSLCYLLHHCKDKIAEGNRYDSATPEGHEFLQDWNDGKYTRGVPFPGVPNAVTVRALFEEVAARPVFDPVRPILLELKRERKKWYGAQNVYQLAKNLKRLSEYKFVYGMWSREVHGGDIRPVHQPIRRSAELNDLAGFAPMLLGTVILLVSRKLKPELEGDIKIWYKQHVALPEKA